MMMKIKWILTSAIMKALTRSFTWNIELYIDS